MTSEFRIALATAATVLALALGSPASAAMSDPWITTKVKMTLLTTSGVHATAINVDTIDGRVTLHGTVDSQDEKAKAEVAAQGIQGVREVRNLLQVVAPAKQDVVAASDDVVQSNVASALQREQSLHDSDITVASVNDGTVVLRGTAKTMSDQLRALEVASNVPGVHAVSSEITGPDTMSDSEIWGDTTDAAHRAGDAPQGAVHDSMAAVGDAGKKMANGVADAGKSAAGAVADAGRGVSSTVADAWITSSAKVRLMANGETPARDINVDTMDGKVTLFGTVPSADAKRAAEQEVRKVSGVKSVDNELTVVPAADEKQVAATDAEIKDRVEARLEKAGADDVDVEVSKGTVRLTGTVGTQSDRLQALTTARATDGVRSVVDSLRVDSADHASR